MKKPIFRTPTLRSLVNWNWPTLLYSRQRPSLPHSRHGAIQVLALLVVAPPALENALLPIGIAAPVVAEKPANERNGSKMNEGLPAWQPARGTPPGGTLGGTP